MYCDGDLVVGSEESDVRMRAVVKEAEVKEDLLAFQLLT